MQFTYSVNIDEGIKVDCVADENLHVKVGEDVIIRGEKSEDNGTVLKCYSDCSECEGASAGARSCRGKRGDKRGESNPVIVRKMTLQDKGRAHENETRAKSMLRTAQRKVHEHNLDMKLLSCHYTFDKSLVIFLFSAEGRVDFRNLVRDLSGALHNRVELRQIGVRDEASLQGGMGPCGRPFCCATILSRFESVNVKMAKAQRLSLNPHSVSGGCGRLKCCLRYEVEGYKEMYRNMPRNGQACDTPLGPGRVTDCNALTQMVRVRLEKNNMQITEFPVEEVTRRKGDNGRDGGGGNNQRNAEKGSAKEENSGANA